MPTDRRITFFHVPNSRSAGTRILLDELGADYELQALNLKSNEQRGARYLALNPMGKVPAIQHAGALVTEQAAVFMYLADLYPEAGLAPAVGDPLRGPYLRWMVFYGSCFEPAVVDRSMNRPPVPLATSPYGDFDTMLDTVTQQLSRGPYLLGERFTAADLMWGMALAWATGFRLVPLRPEFQAYISQVTGRPSVARVRAQDAALAAAQP